MIEATGADMLRVTGEKISVGLPNANGFIGRECPVQECLGHFMIKPGTGLIGKDLPCRCPYCGHTGAHDQFWREEQLKYVQSVVHQQLVDALRKPMRDMARRVNSQRGLVTMQFKPGSTPPIRHYREKQLETEVTCAKCTLQFTIYGVFAYCPDCGVHNSFQILEKNLDLVEKQLSLVAQVEGELAAHLVGDALENAVSAFDGFGREIARVNATHATNQTKAEGLSFQNLTGAQRNVQDLFGFDISLCLSSEQWTTAIRGFQKRHLLSHSMGVVDKKYMAAANDPHAVLGRKVTIRPEEVSELASILRTLGAALCEGMAKLSSP